MAHMTRETPTALQVDNYMPTEYFFRLLADYESRMVIYRREIKKAESSIAALESHCGLNGKGSINFKKFVPPRHNNPLILLDLCLSLKAVKDSLVVIAAKVKTLHEKVNSEVETHKNLLRFVQGHTARREGHFRL